MKSILDFFKKKQKISFLTFKTKGHIERFIADVKSRPYHLSGSEWMFMPTDIPLGVHQSFISKVNQNAKPLKIKGAFELDEYEIWTMKSKQSGVKAYEALHFHQKKLMLVNIVFPSSEIDKDPNFNNRLLKSIEEKYFYQDLNGRVMRNYLHLKDRKHHGLLIELGYETTLFYYHDDFLNFEEFKGRERKGKIKKDDDSLKNYI
ncbi:MAG: hypothetical protein LAT68_07055 [Cyclobacteriaceae bacterium]|nr:hypothetical protein [Cyclobacteriaceae bacterium]MCH8516072.1 hypothetical protein [Cyclobacteriaceae bacterium]